MKETISYKLIKELPEQPKVGAIESYFGDGMSTPVWRGTEYYESHLEFWEKVDLDKEYEIINYIITDGVFKGSRTDNINNCGLLGHEFKINSVKRLSDNEIFTVGETITRVNSFNSKLVINRFRVDENEILVIDYKELGYCNYSTCQLKDIKKIVESKYPIIKTFVDHKFPSNFFSEKDGLYGCGGSFSLSLNNFLHHLRCVDSGDYYISEVAISETETLKIGDKVEYIGNPGVKNSVPFFIIDKFYYTSEGLTICRSKDDCNIEDVMTVRIYQEPKISFVTFLTEDNVIVYENYNVHWVSNHSGMWKYLYELKLTLLHKYILGEDSSFKIFSSKHEAELFILNEERKLCSDKLEEANKKYHNKLKECK